MSTRTPSSTAAHRLAQLEQRVQRLEAATSIRCCVNRYMTLCDSLDASTPLPALLDCFTENAVWRGIGSRYGKSFGEHKGRIAIGAMFSRYMSDPPHFAFNAHFLCSEQIEVSNQGTAQAQWLMLQTSTFNTGRSHLNAAHLRLSMSLCDDGQWRIAQFETENLLSRPVETWHSEAALPVPTQ